MSYILLVALALGQCDCGPGCGCSQYGPCLCIRADADTPPALPRIDRGTAIADELRRPVIVWVGQRDADAEAALPEAIHCYAAAIVERSGPGVAYAAYSPGGDRSWLWIGGTCDSVAALAACCGSRSAWSASAGCCGYYGYGCGMGADTSWPARARGIGACGIGGCAGGACGIGGCAGGACGVRRGGGRR